MKIRIKDLKKNVNSSVRVNSTVKELMVQHGHGSLQGFIDYCIDKEFGQWIEAETIDFYNEMIKNKKVAK